MTDFLFIHGAGHGAWVWDRVKGIVEDSLRRRVGLYHAIYSPGTILAPDLPGHGSRSGRDDPLEISFDGAVDELLGQMEAHGVSRPVIAVHNLSGLIALELVRRMKEPPRALVLVGAAVPDLFHTAAEMLPLPTRVLLALLRFRPGTPPDSMRLHQAVGAYLLCSDMPYSRASAQVVGKLCPVPLRLLDALPHPEALEPRCPVTYAVLTRDWYVLTGSQRQMAATFPGARVVEIDSGHEAPITHAEEVAELLLAYA